MISEFQFLRAIRNHLHCVWKNSSLGVPKKRLPHTPFSGYSPKMIEWFRLLPNLSLFSFPLKGSSNFILFFVNLKMKGPAWTVWEMWSVCLCIQGEQHINIFLMCFRHVQRHKEGTRPGRLVSVHLPSFALIETALLEHAFWNFEQTNFLCPQELIGITIPFQNVFFFFFP